MVVAAEDGDGNVDTSFSGNVTITDWWQTLGGTTTVTAVNGVATFSDLTLDQATSDEVPVRTAAAVSSVTSSTFAVTAAAATQLSFSYVDNAAVGSPFSTTVNALDPYGNVDTNYNGDVTLALATNPDGATLGGTLTQTAVERRGHFQRFDANKEARLHVHGHQRRLDRRNVRSLRRDGSTGGHHPAAQQCRSGSTFRLVVAAEDGDGNMDTSYSGSVTVSSNIGGSLLVGQRQ